MFSDPDSLQQELGPSMLHYKLRGLSGSPATTEVISSPEPGWEGVVRA